MSICYEDYIDEKKFDDLKRYTLTSLGFPAVKVELTDEQMKEAIQSALNTMALFVGKKRYAYTPAYMRQSEYDVPADCQTVIRVYYNLPYLSALGNTSTALFSDFYLLASDLAVDIYESPVTFWCYLASREMLTKIYGTWTDFEVIEGGNRIRIYPAPLVREDILCIFYRSTEIDLSRDYANLFRDLSLAYSMRTLGRIRSKYQSGLPSSGGNGIQLDGQQLLQDAKEEIARVKDELLKRDPLEIQIF